MTDNIFPRARRADLLIQEVLDETLVYDTQTAQAHLLNSSAAAIWRTCDGNSSIDSIAAQIGETFGAVCDKSVICRALEQFDERGLLETTLPTAPLAASEVLLPRRSLIKKAGAVAVLIAPFVATIVVPTPAMGASPCAPGPQGPQGPQGPCGPQGPQGPQGRQGARNSQSFWDW